MEGNLLTSGRYHVAEIGCVRSGRMVVYVTSALVVGIEPSGRLVAPRELPRLVVGIVTQIPVFPEILDDRNRAWLFPRVCGGKGSGRPGGLFYLGEVVSVESVGMRALLGRSHGVLP
jgi:hypothetical protein